MAANAPSNAELAQQIAQLAQVVTNLAAAVQAGNPAAGTAPTPVNFATSPGTADVDQLIDYSTKRGSALYEQGVRELASPFDLKSEQCVVLRKN